MTRDQLIRELEFYQDLGLRTLHLPEAQPAASANARGAKPASPVPATVSPATNSPGLEARTPRAPVPAAGTPPSAPLQLRSLAVNAMPSMYDALGVDPKEDSLTRIREDIGDCKRCRLCQGRNKIVFGAGNESAKLVFVGEGPGEDEDHSGLPFVGRAGQLLTKMIEGTAEREGIAIQRKDVYICNVVKCRPPSNRKPENDEMEICGQFLYRQLAVLNPKAICVLGATAAQALLNTKERIGKMRGEWFRWREIPVMVTYHPSYLLRAYNADAKREAWEDLKKALHFVYDDPANLPKG
ncbi:MAG: uracil-DNA glycosylase family protein [Bryobacterales bacterium]|nr:uracil-DNA glycosylase family protein [Bryobacterales bacterium]